jgi:hypothetical protein
MTAVPLLPPQNHADVQDGAMRRNNSIDNFSPIKKRSLGPFFQNFFFDRSRDRSANRELTVSDVHRDFETETQIGSSRGGPCHD